METIKAAEIVRESVSFEAAARHYGLEFNRSGSALCPFHSEDTPSFRIQRGKYGHCFGCGWNGDVISFVKDLLGLDFRGAVQRLAADFGVPVYLDVPPTLRQKREAEKRYREIRTEKERRDAEKRAYEKRYDELWRKWCTLDRWRREYAPKSPDEPFSRLYVYAVKHIDRVGDQIDTEL